MRCQPWVARVAPVVTATAAMLWSAAPAHAAPVFDEPSYYACTATTAPPPDGNFDVVVTDCCAHYGGLPTPTNYGVGCVAQVDNPPPDYRPTIVLPMRPSQESPDDIGLGELEKLPPLP